MGTSDKENIRMGKDSDGNSYVDVVAPKKNSQKTSQDATQVGPIIVVPEVGRRR